MKAKYKPKSWMMGSVANMTNGRTRAFFQSASELRKW